MYTVHVEHVTRFLSFIHPFITCVLTCWTISLSIIDEFANVLAYLLICASSVVGIGMIGNGYNATPYNRVPHYYIPQLQGLMQVFDVQWSHLFVWTINNVCSNSGSSRSDMIHVHQLACLVQVA